jgi:hypothetical protein
MEITGFDEQIGIARNVKKVVARNIQPKQVVRRVIPASKIKVKKPIATRNIQQTQVVTRVMPGSKIKVKKPIATVQASRVVKPGKTVAVKRSVINKLIEAKKVQSKKVMAPVSKSPILTAKQFNNINTKLKAAKQRPNQLLKLNDVARSFAKVDLPFQKVTPSTKFQKLKNTPLNLPVNINMIEPAVDSGSQNYYGK